MKRNEILGQCLGGLWLSSLVFVPFALPLYPIFLSLGLQLRVHLIGNLIYFPFLLLELAAACLSWAATSRFHQCTCLNCMFPLSIKASFLCRLRFNAE